MLDLIMRNNEVRVVVDELEHQNSCHRLTLSD